MAGDDGGKSDLLRPTPHWLFTHSHTLFASKFWHGIHMLAVSRTLAVRGYFVPALATPLYGCLRATGLANDPMAGERLRVKSPRRFFLLAHQGDKPAPA
jgi:hypothetical protein